VVKSLAPGDVIAGMYRIEGLLSDEGANHVYRAAQLSTGKTRALKILPPDHAATQIKEAEVFSRAGGEHVAHVLDASAEGDPPWMAMELAGGVSLRERVEREGPIPASGVRVMIDRIAAALAKLGERGVVHRDLRPEKVMWSLDGDRIMLLPPAIVDHDLRHIPWVSPEQVNDRAFVTPAADVWSLGLLAFYLLTGKRYWKGQTPSEVIGEIMMSPLVLASVRARELGVGGELPHGFDAWFDRCVQRAPGARFPTPAEASLAFPPIPRAFEPQPILANPKGSFYDQGLQDGLSSNDFEAGDVDKKAGYRDPLRPPPEIPGDREPIILANPKGSFYDRGLTSPRSSNRWLVLAVLLGMIAGAAFLLLRR
jgi:serine/threonine-protein kinase